MFKSMFTKKKIPDSVFEPGNRVMIKNCPGYDGITGTVKLIDPRSMDALNIRVDFDQPCEINYLTYEYFAKDELELWTPSQKF